MSRRHADTYPSLTPCPSRSGRIQHMSRAVQELYEKASELARNDRAELAGLLLESIEEPSDQGVEEAWAAEIERRMAEFRAGRVKTIPWSEVRARLHRSDR
jgi:putative addiction module component (TIGR02574 family)